MFKKSLLLLLVLPFLFGCYVAPNPYGPDYVYMNPYEARQYVGLAHDVLGLMYFINGYWWWHRGPYWYRWHGGRWSHWRSGPPRGWRGHRGYRVRRWRHRRP